MTCGRMIEYIVSKRHIEFTGCTCRGRRHYLWEGGVRCILKAKVLDANTRNSWHSSGVSGDLFMSV